MLYVEYVRLIICHALNIIHQTTNIVFFRIQEHQPLSLSFYLWEHNPFLNFVFSLCKCRSPTTEMCASTVGSVYYVRRNRTTWQHNCIMLFLAMFFVVRFFFSFGGGSLIFALFKYLFRLSTPSCSLQFVSVVG